MVSQDTHPAIQSTPTLASNRVPKSLGTLGLTEEQLKSHIAWDLGTSNLSQELSANLDATWIEARFSRPVYDYNRLPEAISAMPENTDVYFMLENDKIVAASWLASRRRQPKKSV